MDAQSKQQKRKKSTTTIGHHQFLYSSLQNLPRHLTPFWTSNLDQSLPFGPPHFLGIPFLYQRLQFGLLIQLRFGHQIWIRVFHLDPILNQSLPLPRHRTLLWASILDRCLPLPSHVTPGLGINSGPESRPVQMHWKTSGHLQHQQQQKFF